MNYHRNATTTIAVRKAIRECPLPAGKAANKFNVNINTIYKWRRRSEDDLQDRSNATKVISFTLTDFERHLICEMKKLTLFSIDDLLQVLKSFIPKLTPKNLYTTLKQNHLNRNEYIIPKEATKNEVKKFKDYDEGFIHVDIKFLPKINGKRKYLFAAIDRRTRLVCAKIYDDKSKESSADFFNEIIDFFPFKITKILTDNGKEFTDKFHKGRKNPSGNHIVDSICKENGIEHRLTKAYTPKTNGMIERFNRRIQENVLDKFRFNNIDEMKKNVFRYLHEYNFYIKQKKLDYKSPISFIEKELPDVFNKFIKQYNLKELYNRGVLEHYVFLYITKVNLLDDD
jgi:transposase-like protein